MRRLLTLAALLCCLGSAAAPSGPGRTLLNNGWRFALGNASDMMADFTHGTEYFTYYCKVRTTNQGHAPIMPEFDDSAWQTVSLPHDWVVDLPFSGEASHSHGYKCIGWKYPQNSVGWYRKTLYVPEEWRGEQVSVEFEGIFRASQVFINGYYLGTELSGYSSATYDLSNYLDFGQDNVICVRVDASTEEGWFYEGAGIYRNVWLHRSGPAAIKPYSLAVDGGKASYELQLAFGADESRVSERQTILDADGVEVPEATHLWSIDDPYLYTLRLELFYDGKPSATYLQKFGVRTVEFSPSEGFLLNGERVQLKGCDLHLDAAGVGVGVPDELWRYKLEQLRKYGFNAIRCSHNPATPAMLDLCDRLGFVVIDEQRQFATGAEQKAQLRNMIKRDRNHPSVILWSVGNEEWAAEWNEHGTLIARELTAFAHSIDPTRPTTYGSSGGPMPNKGVDVFGYNYVIQNVIADMQRDFPAQTGVGTEETSGCGTRGKYKTDPEEGWMLSHNRNGVDNRPMAGIGSYVCSPDGAEGTMKMPMTPDGKVLNAIERGWRYYHSHPELGGLFYWTGFDYRGESNPMVWPATGSEFGILDYCGFPKDEAWYLKSVWQSEPLLKLAPHWNAPVAEGEPIEVWAYTNCEKVTLYVNGKNLGTRKVDPDGIARWQTTYRPGKLEAVGKCGKQTLRTVVETTGEAVGIEMKPWKTALRADGQDVTVIDIYALDARGRFVPDAALPLAVSVEGADFLGWGNGNPGFKAVERPVSGESLDIETFSGCAQILVRSIEGRAGCATVSAGGEIVQITINN